MLHAASASNAQIFTGIIITGSWDKTVRTWDPRQPQPTGTYSQPDKVNNSSSLKKRWIVLTDFVVNYRSILWH